VTLDNDTIRKIFEEEIPFLRKVKVVVEEVKPRYARLSFPHEEGNENYWGTSHAGALFTFGESCGGVLVAASFPLADIVLLAKGAKISYLKGVRGDLKCELSISEEEIKKIMDKTEVEGSCVYPISMEFKNDKGEVAAEMSVDYYFKKRK
jgi:acyl-coenzyme A thioesterase PaaI-like protein